MYTKRRRFNVLLRLAVAVLLTVSGAFLFQPFLVHAATSVVWDDRTGGNDSNATGDELGGYFLQFDSLNAINYPMEMSVVTGLADMTFEQSAAVGVDMTYAAIWTQLAKTGNPDDKIVVGGLSQGAAVANRTLKLLEQNGADTHNVDFILMGNVDSNNGGAFSVLPFGYIPIVGVAFGQSTSPQYTRVVEISNEYDMASRFPVYPLNILSVANAAVAFFLCGAHVYDDVVYDPNDLDGPNNNYVVTHSADGLVTNIVIPSKELPIIMPFKELASALVGQQTASQLADIVRPVLKVLVDMGYYPLGEPYPSTPLRLSLVPPLPQLVKDVELFGAGLSESLHRLQSFITTGLALSPSQAVTNDSITDSLIQNEASEKTSYVSPKKTARAAPSLNMDSVSNASIDGSSRKQSDRPKTTGRKLLPMNAMGDSESQLSGLQARSRNVKLAFGGSGASTSRASDSSYKSPSPRG